MTRDSRKSEGVNREDNLKAKIKDAAERARANTGFLDSYSEGHEIEFDTEKVYELYKGARDEMLKKKDATGIKLLIELITKAWQYFEAIEVAHRAFRDPNPNALKYADMARSAAHNSFIKSLLDVETHLTSNYSGKPLGSGIYFPDRKKDLGNPYASDERGFIRTFGYALLSSLRTHAEDQ